MFGVDFYAGWEIRIQFHSSVFRLLVFTTPYIEDAI